MVQHVFEHLIPHSAQKADRAQSLEALLEAHGFDRVEHEQIQADLRSGGSAWRRTAFPSPAASPMSARMTSLTPPAWLGAALP